MRIEHCRGCNAEIVWLKTATGKAMPVDAGSVKEGDTIYAGKTKANPAGYHVAHWGTCAVADKFHKRERKVN